MRQQIAGNPFLFLAEAVAWRYSACGRVVSRFLLGKLKYDPVYRGLLNLPIWDEAGLVVDLGCGQGIFLAVLATARNMGMLPGGKSVKRELTGVELDPVAAGRARLALQGDAVITIGDLRSEPVPPCHIALLIDVLYHLTREEQDALLGKVVAALEPGGVLLLREADAGAGLRYEVTWLAEAAVQLMRGNHKAKRHYRSTTDWKACLEHLGLTVETQQMNAGTPFANVLLMGRRPAMRLT